MIYTENLFERKGFLTKLKVSCYCFLETAVSLQETVGNISSSAIEN